jgi:hypothetical protein
LGIGNVSTVGDTPASMAALATVTFDPAKIPTSLAGCYARLVVFLESTGALDGFSPTTTFYLLTVPSDHENFAAVTYTAYPAAATVMLNGAGIYTPVPLGFDSLDSLNEVGN